MPYICASCIEENTLKNIVQLQSKQGNCCDYCEENEPVVDMFFIAEKCNEVISNFYEPSSLTMAVIVYDYTPAGKQVSEVLANLIGAPEDAIEALVELLQDMWYDRDADEHLYGEDPWFVPCLQKESALSRDWEDMETSLRNEGRFLNPKVAMFMDTVFGDIAHDLSENGLPVLVDAGPGTKYEGLYRSRVFQSEKSILNALEHPEKFLGAPPVGIGAGGRMNASGQPAFYGSTDVKTTLSEVRPVVGSWIVSAKFSIDRQLKLLDLRLLGKMAVPVAASLFDEKTKATVARHGFLRKLSREMVVPVMPEHQEHSYLVTQVIANYLATHRTATIDGIIYSSVQLGEETELTNGENVVIFYKSAITANADGDERTAHAQLWEYDEDGPGRYLSPAIEFLEVKPRTLWRAVNNSPSNASLSLMRESIEVHEIKSIQITTKSAPFNIGTHYFNR